jgi:uncharacterized protein
MKPDQLDRVDHRPWPIPREPWVMRQVWESLAFLHWPFPADALRRLLSPEVAIDTFDGHAWVGLVPFHLSSIRLRGCPPMPGLRHFLELNVRTYVTRDRKPGVWFLTLDAESLLAVLIARRWYRLSYFLANIRMDRVGSELEFAAQRRGHSAPKASFQSRIAPCRDALEHANRGRDEWLTERYCLYSSDRTGRLYGADIHHAPWTLRAADADIVENTMLTSLGLDAPTTQPIVHLADRIEALIWPPRRIA